MSIRLSSVKVEIDKNSEPELKTKIAKVLKIKESEIVSFKPSKLSIDARKKSEIRYVYSFDIKLKNEIAFLKHYKGNDVSRIEQNKYNPFPGTDLREQIDFGNKRTDADRPIIAGMGPAGLFCGLFLARAGLKPIILERGEDVDNRIKSVENFWDTGELNASSNVQFGEGGAGTFSDGKLNTLIRDSAGRIRAVYEEFVEHGAAPDILYINKPHIGTDRLIHIVKSIREEIISLGGEVRFGTCLKEIITEDSAVKAVKVQSSSQGIRTLECTNLVLAIGHSARDTFEMLYNAGIKMEQKPFAIGVRVQHSQEMISRSQYGDLFDKLPPADYKVTANLANGRGVYSFCMCPGGFVVNASSEEGRLAVNGMSNSKRDEKTANSAIVVSVSTNDFDGNDPLAGMRLQRCLEENAFKCCNGKVPVQHFGKFRQMVINKNKDDNLASDNECISGIEASEKIAMTDKAYTPNIKGLWQPGNVAGILPDYISESIVEAFPAFGRMIKGFDNDDTLMIGLESRTSSPVRICRNDKLEAVGIHGLYPCGEGAGYAGGITSAAVDGLRVYEAIVAKFLERNV